MDHAARIIEGLVEERHARDAGLLEQLQQLGDRRVLVDGDDVGARHHDVVDAQRAEPQQAQQHLALGGRERGLGLVLGLERLLERVAQRLRPREAEPRAQRLQPALAAARARLVVCGCGRSSGCFDVGSFVAHGGACDPLNRCGGVGIGDAERRRGSSVSSPSMAAASASVS